jgi:hypothetical protein
LFSNFHSTDLALDSSSMAEPKTPDPVLLVVAAFSRHDTALAWSRIELEQIFGPLGLAGPSFVFHETAYYESTMGSGLLKQFLAFHDLVDPAALASIKMQTNSLEAQLARLSTFPEERPLNLDPGILSLGKFMLATTKDQGHRIYLRDGIFAEVTLRYQAGSFEPWPWTYADYRRPEVHEFLESARNYYRERLRSHRGQGDS